MSGDLQTMVDDLARRLRRPVLLEDHIQRVIVYSEQDGPMDDVRRDSILRRHTTPEVRQRLRAAGIFTSAGPIRIAGTPSLGLLPRVCVPTRHDGRLLGFLWLIDSDPSMSEEDILLAGHSAPGVALELFRDSLVSGSAARREIEAVGSLLAGDPDAARILIESGYPQSDGVAALVVRPVGDPDDELRLAIERGLLTVRFRYAARHPLHLVRYDHGVLLSTGIDPRELYLAVGNSVVVGVGRPRASLAEAALSYREALHAAEVAARIPGFGEVAEWSGLGVYRLLGNTSGELHPGIDRLLGDPAHAVLLETLETYLDLAGSAVATAKSLRLHRTSLYYRLQRVEELVGTDLKDGGERLALHLSLKLVLRDSGCFM